jgi:uncharacterized protein
VVTAFPEGEEWPRFAKGLECRLDIDRTQHELVIRVDYRGDVVLSCARCLNEFPMAVAGRCVVIARSSESRGKTGYLDDDSSEYCYDDEEQKVDLAQALFDEVMTALPMKPLCSERCPGVDAEDDGVVAGGGEIDPRWEALRKLRVETGSARKPAAKKKTK